MALLISIDEYREYPTRDDNCCDLKVGDRLRLNNTVANPGDIGAFLEITSVHGDRLTFEMKECELI